MKAVQGHLLCVNGGSSSIKFALYQPNGNKFLKLFSGSLTGIGSDNVSIKATLLKDSIVVPAAHNGPALGFLIDWIKEQQGTSDLLAIGHRIVHGMSYSEPQLVTKALLNHLKEISAYDPEHLPEEIKIIETLIKAFPSVPQVACFDTAFHSHMPSVAQMIAIPRKYISEGIKRYGFHGLSYAYLLEELKRVGGLKVANGKVILAHLGSGASLAAVKNGKSVDTSMGFTPTSGMPMSTRTGDLDPGVAAYLLQHQKLSPHEFNHLINHESGLLGISETSPDMQELLRIRHRDTRATEAVNLFCYQLKKFIGAYAAVLSGLDVLVFSGGIGENAAAVRELACYGLDFLGLEIDQIKNKKNELIISKKHSRVTVYVMPANEELMMARLVSQVIKITVK